ncbi:prepilin-type N-terminal cleavage/methylation domain-containing protein [Aliidiomarina halalkaliphila]|uniref:Prepilin-type N-terminal cleavage/methylation domain-containing protein n=1 Tax=Aliidiomarina halalkaliphila TaxID=2593535 RepID=A0A552X5J5_9GAMM|nr:prepilin-type N-terminal cleavage/methylation domain-containing protein [Aliidiomarina halalkaliphila]TRW50280.1 prepilin-type N-terminal cleavage/methylation domain-containing protein [Aliidiomarina halalkaliphila]
MRPVKFCGFSLLELMLALSIASITLLAALQIFTQMWAQARLGQQRADALQSFYQLGHWSVRALLLEQKANPTSVPERQADCILLGTIGLRVRSQQLQWRPEEGDCETNGWHGLHDPSHLRIDGLQLHSQQFCLQGRYRGDTASWQWCHPWYP